MGQGWLSLCPLPPRFVVTVPQVNVGRDEAQCNMTGYFVGTRGLGSWELGVEGLLTWPGHSEPPHSLTRLSVLR